MIMFMEYNILSSFIFCRIMINTWRRFYLRLQYLAKNFFLMYEWLSCVYSSVPNTSLFCTQLLTQVILLVAQHAVGICT